MFTRSRRRASVERDRAAACPGLLVGRHSATRLTGVRARPDELTVARLATTAPPLEAERCQSGRSRGWRWSRSSTSSTRKAAGVRSTSLSGWSTSPCGSP